MESSSVQSLDIVQVLISSFIKKTTTDFRSRCFRLKDATGRNMQIVARDGLTFLTYDDRKVKKERFEEKVVVAPGDDSGDLEPLTQELKRFTEEVNDIEVEEFRLTWGIMEGAIPCLLSCDGSTFRYTEKARHYRKILKQIVVFIALETSRRPVNGKCFAGRKVCMKSSLAVPREKVEMNVIKKLARTLKCDPHRFTTYVKDRINVLAPSLMTASVPVCRNCFSLYDREHVPRSARPQCGSQSVLGSWAAKPTSSPRKPVSPRSPVRSSYERPTSGMIVELYEKPPFRTKF